MLPLLAAFLAGVAIDPRLVTGAPVWLKPAKFAASIAIYAFTLAWAFSFLGEWRRVRAIVGRLSAIVLMVEMAIIAAQAARGTTSHFNVEHAARRHPVHDHGRRHRAADADQRGRGSRAYGARASTMRRWAGRCGLA